MYASCVYTCLNIHNPLSDHLFKRYANFITDKMNVVVDTLDEENDDK